MFTLPPEALVLVVRVRLLKGVGRPDEVMACVEAGVDLFEGFFPFQVTERGCALCFNYIVTPDPETAGTTPLTGGPLSTLPSQSPPPFSLSLSLFLLLNKVDEC